MKPEPYPFWCRHCKIRHAGECPPLAVAAEPVSGLHDWELMPVMNLSHPYRCRVCGEKYRVGLVNIMSGIGDKPPALGCVGPRNMAPPGIGSRWLMEERPTGSPPSAPWKPILDEFEVVNVHPPNVVVRSFRHGSLLSMPLLRWELAGECAGVAHPFDVRMIPNDYP